METDWLADQKLQPQQKLEFAMDDDDNYSLCLQEHTLLTDLSHNQQKAPVNKTR